MAYVISIEDLFIFIEKNTLNKNSNETKQTTRYPYDESSFYNTFCND